MIRALLFVILVSGCSAVSCAPPPPRQERADLCDTSTCIARTRKE